MPVLLFQRGICCIYFHKSYQRCRQESERGFEDVAHVSDFAFVLKAQTAAPMVKQRESKQNQKIQGCVLHVQYVYAKTKLLSLFKFPESVIKGHRIKCGWKQMIKQNSIFTSQRLYE